MAAPGMLNMLNDSSDPYEAAVLPRPPYDVAMGSYQQTWRDENLSQNYLRRIRMAPS
jgi:hypothetical protein